jgi:type IV secretory pathway TrbF-like protein
MFKKRKPTSPETVISEPHSAIYAAARREYNEQVGSIVSQRDNWRLTAFGCLFVSAVAVGGMTWVSTRPALPPFVVKVDKLGNRVVVARADVMEPADPEVIAGQLAEWAANTRTVYTDVMAQRRIIDSAYAIVGKEHPAFRFLNKWFAENVPWDRARTETVSVQEINVTPPAAGNSWQIDWAEYHQGRDGTQYPKEHWRGTVTISFDKAATGAINLQNPTGLWIENIDWRKLDPLGARS